MNEPMTAWVKLYHPRGPQVTLPLPSDARAALDAVTLALDSGWLAQQPGLEEGEEKEQIGWVLRGLISNEGRETPFVLLYSANEAFTWSILKVYLNTDQDIAAFEHASKMKLAELPEYVGNDKPQRSAAGKTDRYIIPVPRHFGVVFKKNPKHDSTEQGKMKPARLFVRWADQKPAEPPQDGPVTVAEQDELNSLMAEYERVTKTTINTERMLAWLEASSLISLTRPQWRKACDDLRKKIAAKGGVA